MELPRQPRPVKVTVECLDPLDEPATVNSIHKFLERLFNDTTIRRTENTTTIWCYPRAAND